MTYVSTISNLLRRLSGSVFNAQHLPGWHQNPPYPAMTEGGAP